jgi:hypothetical protein
MGELICPLCGKSAIRDNWDGHIIEWAGDGWKLTCPEPIVVEKPLSHCELIGVEVKHG